MIMKYLSYCGIYTTRGKYRFAVLFFLHVSDFECLFCANLSFSVHLPEV